MQHLQSHADEIPKVNDCCWIAGTIDVAKTCFLVRFCYEVAASASFGRGVSMRHTSSSSELLSTHAAPAVTCRRDTKGQRPLLDCASNNMGINCCLVHLCYEVAVHATFGHSSQLRHLNFSSDLLSPDAAPAPTCRWNIKGRCKLD